MSSIPLPALAIRPPEQTDVLGSLGKLMALKSAVAQQQTQQLQQQGLAQENQARQMDIDSTKAFQKAYTEAKGDPEQTMRLAASYGAKPQALVQMQTAFLDQKMKALDLVSKQGAEAKRQADLVQGAHDAVATATPEDRPAAWQQQLLGLHQQGVDVSQMPMQYPGDQAFHFLGAVVKGHAQQVEEALKTQEAAKNQAQAGEADAASAKAQAESQWYQAHGGAPGVPVEAQQQADWLQKNRGKTPSDYVLWKAQHSPSVLLQGGLNGSSTDPAIDMVGEGRMDYATATARYSPAARKAFDTALAAKYPTFNQGTFGIEKKVGEDFTSGPDAQKLQAFNTAITHMGVFKQTADALDNNDTQILNKIGNAVGVQFGSDKATNFTIAKQAFIGEVTRAFDGAGVTMHDREQVEKQISAASSPAQLKGAANTAELLLRGKREVLKEQYESGRQGKPDFGNDRQATAPSSDAFDWSKMPQHQ